VSWFAAERALRAHDLVLPIDFRSSENLPREFLWKCIPYWS
jgi:hypothetical protein